MNRFEKKPWLTLAFIVFQLCACTGVLTDPEAGPAGPSSSDPGPEPTPGAPAPGPVDDTIDGMGMPCAVIDLLSARCIACHSDPPRAGATMPLLTYAHLTTPSPSDPSLSMVEQAALRMREGTMPPAPLPAALDAEISAVERWIVDGFPPTTCADAPAHPPGPVALEGTGQEVFGAVCATCHGAAGEGTRDGYELQHPVRGYARFVVRNGRPGPEHPDVVMDAWGPEVLTETQLDEIFDFLDSAPRPTTGRGLYVDFCGNCHGADALGGVVDQDLEGKTRDEIIQNVREGNGDQDYHLRLDYMPAWSPDELSVAELDLIIDYLGTM